MLSESKELKIRNTVTLEDKELLRWALDGIHGWGVNPIAVVTNGIEDYYFICNVKNLKMKIAKVYVKILNDSMPQLLSIEEIY